MKKTALHENHVSLKAKMGEFAGYDMPLFYPAGVMEEHKWTRSHAGIFDVSHMGQITLEGEKVAEFLEHITPSAFKDKAHGRAQYTVLTNEEGGIIDDLIITRMSDNKFFAVINAGCKDKDIAWIKQKLPAGIRMHYMENHALIAIQGAWAERIVHETFEFEATELPYMHMAKSQTKYGVPVFISRVGYTGEDGFEISVANEHASDIWDEFNGHAEVKPIGLAARDSLRLEMGYALYGHDIDAQTSPVEADLGWILRKGELDCIGAARINKERENGPSRKRVGVKILDKGVAREGSEIKDEDGNVIGALTSGGFSPSLEQAIGQGYVPAEFSEAGQKIFVNVRGRDLAAEVHAMPFLKAKTKSMKKKAA